MSELVRKIEEIVGPKGVLTGEDVGARANDWLGQTPCRAKAIVRPANTDEVAALMSLCAEHRQPIVPAGGLTGLVSGAQAADNEIMLSFERMREIESVDPVGRTMTVQAGAPLQAVHDEARRHGLIYGVDLGARGSCTIGGNISTNAGGNNVVRYGMTREQILGLEVVLSSGAVVSSMNTLLKNNTGYDLKHLFVGSEGTLGVVTRAVLRLHPAPQSANTAMVAVSSFGKLTSLFSFLGQRLGGSLAAFEVMWRDYYDIIAVQSGNHQPPLSEGSSFYAIIEAHGVSAERDAASFLEAVEAAAEEKIIEDAVIAQSEQQRLALWAIREDIAGVATLLLPGGVFDVSLPISEMDLYVCELKRRVVEKWGETARVVVFGHIGDGNLHIVVSLGDWNDALKKSVEKMVYEPLSSIGGSISAEHGIGLEKKPYLPFSRTDSELALMRQLKTALDPHNLLNPGKLL